MAEKLCTSLLRPRHLQIRTVLSYIVSLVESWNPFPEIPPEGLGEVDILYRVRVNLLELLGLSWHEHSFALHYVLSSSLDSNVECKFEIIF